MVRTKDRDSFQNYLTQNGIGSIIHYPIPPHLSEAYKNLGYCRGDLPVTEQYAGEVLSIPMYSGLTKEEQERVIRVINDYNEN